MIWLFPPRTTWSNCMSHTDYLCALFIIYFLKNLIQNQLSAATATVVTPVVSDKGRSSFVLFFAFIQWYDYVVVYFWLAYFILSIICLNTISTDFVTITENKVSLFSVFDERLFLCFDCFFEKMRSLDESYWPFIYIFSKKWHILS